MVSSQVAGARAPLLAGYAARLLVCLPACLHDPLCLLLPTQPCPAQIVNQLDGFDARGNIKASACCACHALLCLNQPSRLQKSIASCADASSGGLAGCCGVWNRLLCCPCDGSSSSIFSRYRRRPGGLPVPAAPPLCHLPRLALHPGLPVRHSRVSRVKLWDLRMKSSSGTVKAWSCVPRLPQTEEEQRD